MADPPLTLEEYERQHWESTGSYPTYVVPVSKADAEGCCAVCVRRWRESQDDLARLDFKEEGRE